MTTTARIAATNSSDTSYTFSVSGGTSKTFACSDLGISENILIEKRKSDATYDQLYYEDKNGQNRAAKMTKFKNTITLTGPLDARINKPPTGNAVEVVEYS